MPDFDFTAWSQTLIILAITLIASLSARFGLNYLRKSKKSPEWLITLSDTFYGPAFWLILGYGILAILEQLSESSELNVSSEFLGTIRNLFLILGFTWVFIRWKSSFQKLLIQRVSRQEKPAYDKTAIEAVGRLIDITIIIITVFLVLDNLDVQITALLAVGSIGAATIGFAGKDVFANFFGGMMIYINRPFHVGDWIKSPNKNFEGIVENIGWYMTRIRTLTRRPTYIPNALLIDAIIENPGRMYNRQIKTTIGIRYEDIKKCKPIIEDIRKMLQNHSAIDHNLATFVQLEEFAAYSLNILISCFTVTTALKEFREQQQEILLQIADIIERHEAEFAFPTNTVHLQNENPEP